MRIMNMSRVAGFFVSGLVASALGIVHAAPVTIADVAPKDSLFVVSIDDTNAAYEAFSRTGFRKMWDEQSIQSWIENSMKDVFKEAGEGLEKMGIDKDELKRPSGPCGAAVWMAPSKEEGAEPEMRVIVIAEYADNAAAMDAVVRRFVEKGEKDHVIDVTEGDHAGVKTISLKFLETEAEKTKREEAEKKKAEKEKAGEEGDEGDEEFSLDFSDEAEHESVMDKAFKEMHYALVGTTLTCSNEMAALESAIEKLKGERGASIDDSEDYAAITRQLGDQHIKAAFLMKPMREMQAKAAEEAGMAEMEKTMNETMGLNDFRGAGLGIRFDTDDAMMEQKIVASTSGKHGLLALFDTPASPLEAPTFVPSDAASVVMVQIDLPGVVALLNKAMTAMQQVEGGGEAAGMMGGMVGMVTPILNNLGPQIYIVSSYERPLSAESSKMLCAIKTKDAKALSDAITSIAGMWGFTSHDFQGNQVWSAEGGFFPDVAVGIGGGYAFIGATTQVENALRQGTAGDQGATNRLATQDRFKKAMSRVGNSGIGFAYADMRQAIEYYEWVVRNIDKVMEAQIDATFSRMGDPEDPQFKEYRKKALEQAKENIWPPLRTLPSLDVVLNHLGDNVTEMKSTPEGYEIRSLWLRPEGKK
ncbi:MAG TPA: hypothetical protein VG797_07065 [Phycisphaerales bacterium]|nr:hypothetical protein [Phycisphaerales bacterium]